MATDNLFIVYQRIIALLRAEATFIPGTVKLTNFITFDSSNPSPDKQTKSDSDFPEVVFDLSSTRAWIDAGFGPPTPVTFENTDVASTSTTGPSITQRTILFEFVVTSNNMALQPVADVVTAIETTLFKGGFRLGIPSVVAGWGPLQGIWSKTAGATAAKTWRRVCKIQMPVLMKLPGTSITS